MRLARALALKGSGKGSYVLDPAGLKISASLRGSPERQRAAGGAAGDDDQLALVGPATHEAYRSVVSFASRKLREGQREERAYAERDAKNPPLRAGEKSCTIDLRGRRTLELARTPRSSSRGYAPSDGC